MENFAKTINKITEKIAGFELFDIKEKFDDLEKKIKNPDENSTKNLNENLNENSDTKFKIAEQLIVDGESSGKYDAVNKFDIDWVSLGKLQRHGDRARELTRNLFQTNPDFFQKTMGEEFTKTLQNEQGKSLSSLRTTARDAEKTQNFQRLMKNEKMKSTMDTYLQNDIKKYFQKFENRGVTNPSAQMYLARLLNAWILAQNAINETQKMGGDINNFYDLHRGLLQNEYFTQTYEQLAGGKRVRHEHLQKVKETLKNNNINLPPQNQLA